MRASDADRDRVADQLREALAEGRLSPEEHAERIDVLYQAKTYAELVPLLRDLPAAQVPGLPPGPSADPGGRPRVDLRKDAATPAPARQPSQIVAIFSGAERKGRWLAEPQTNVVAVFGGVELDFRTAVLSQREVTVNVSCAFGGVDIKVPPGVRVVNAIAAIFGGCSMPDEDPLEPDAPVIRLTGFALFGGVDVKRREPKADRRARKQERRALHHERRQALHSERQAMRDERRDRLRELRDARRSSRRPGSQG